MRKEIELFQGESVCVPAQRSPSGAKSMLDYSDEDAATLGRECCQ